MNNNKHVFGLIEIKVKKKKTIKIVWIESIRKLRLWYAPT